MFYISLSITTHQKPKLDTPKIREMQSTSLQQIINLQRQKEKEDQMMKEPKKNLKDENRYSNLVVIALNVNGLNSLVKRHRVSERIFNSTRVYYSYKRTCTQTQPNIYKTNIKDLK